MKRAAVVTGTVAVVLLRYLYTPANVRGSSMSPTFLDGQRVYAVKHRRYRVGDVIVFRVPRTVHDAPSWRIKRIAAVAGNPRPAALAGSGLVVTVPAGHVAVVGDNVRSQDSRHLGYIPIAGVAGRVTAARRSPPTVP